jgi:hypothetical protein
LSLLFLGLACLIVSCWGCRSPRDESPTGGSPSIGREVPQSSDTLSPDPSAYTVEVHFRLGEGSGTISLQFRGGELPTAHISFSDLLPDQRLMIGFYEGRDCTVGAPRSSLEFQANGSGLLAETRGLELGSDDGIRSVSVDIPAADETSTRRCIEIPD